jgi:cytosine/adenosine deaminase-related metal-dependent hydrolase
MCFLYDRDGTPERTDHALQGNGRVMALWITNVLINGEQRSIRLHKGQITHLGKIDPVHSEKHIDGEGCWLLPGLINAHDHLGLDLLPRMGNPPYVNSEAWGKEVYQPDRSPIREVWQLSYRERLLWGAYRNLLSGVTTVQHHDRAHPQLGSLPIQVPAYRWCHRPGSKLKGCYGWARHAPFFIHAAEGTDEASYREVEQLHQQGKLGPRTVLIHGVALKPKDIELLEQTGTGLVWCPSSNQFLYEQTAPIQALQTAGITLALGTDSTASGSDTLLAELQTVRGLLPDTELMAMVTTNAARLLGVPERGQLRVGHPADVLLIYSPGASSAAETLMTCSPQDIRLVLVRGMPALVRAPFLESFPSTRLSPVAVNGELTMLQGPIASLLKRSRQLLGERLYFGQHIEPSPLNLPARSYRQ